MCVCICICIWCRLPGCMLSLQCCSRLAGGRTRGRSAHLGQVRFSCGVLQLGLVWCGALGMVCPSAPRYGMVWACIAIYGVVWSGIFWHDMVWHGMAFYGLVLAKCTMVWHGLAEVWKSLAEVWYGLAEVWWGICSMTWYGLGEGSKLTRGVWDKTVIGGKLSTHRTSHSISGEEGEERG